MTAPKPRKPMPPVDYRELYPTDYQEGVDSANRLIDRRRPMLFVTHALELVRAHMANWPTSQGKNAMPDRKYATSKGFEDTLREYREAQADE